jgi:monoamine oxidase
MNINSQYAFYPPQPDNPTDEDRYVLLRYALTQKGWPEDMRTILRLMAPPPPVTSLAEAGSCKGVRVGVIGGGLAGLSAAYELRKMGFDITIFDALTDRPGGRVYTYYFGGDPTLYGEFGPMRIPVAHETVWHYLKLFGLPTHPFIQVNPHAFIYLKGTRVRNDADGVNVKTAIYPKYDLRQWERALSWQRLLSIGTDDRLLRAGPRERAEIIEVRRQYSIKTLEWINQSSMQLMEAAGLSQGAINLVTNFIPLLEGNLYSSFIDYIQESYPADVSYLYGIPGGMVRLPIAFYQSFFEAAPYAGNSPASAGNVSYKTGHQVSGIYLNDGGNKVTLRYQNLQTREKAIETFDYAVCAIPFSTLRAVEISPLFSGIKMRAIREVNYTPSQKSLLLTNQRFWEKQGIVGGGSFTDLPIGSIWYPSDHIQYINNPKDIPDDISRLPSDEPGVIIGSFNFNLDTTRLLNLPEDLALEEMKRNISAVHGLPEGYLDSVVRGYKAVNWNQEPTFRGALSFFTPEQKRLFAYGMALPEYGGRVFFAGEHISAVHRWMQGALQTGMQAANDLVKAKMKLSP